MRNGRTLDDCEVPIALLAWTRRGVEFIDWWAVRRPVIPGTVARAWEPYASSRRMAEGLASIWQFQQQIDDLQSSLPAATLAEFVAHDWLKWLPPVGFLPFAAEPEALAFDVETFFRDVADATPTIVRGGWFAALVRDAAILAPVNLDAREVVQIYRARENSAPDAGTDPRPYIVFATRDTHGPRERDLVARAFRALWLALAKLYRQRALLHPPVSERPTAASQQLSVRVLAFTDAVAAATILAQQFTTLAESRELATADALEAFDTVRTTLFDTLDGLVPTDRRIVLERFDFWKDFLTAFGTTRRTAAAVDSTFLGAIVRAMLARLREVEARVANGQLLAVAATVTALSGQIDAIVDKAVKDAGTTVEEPPA
jgi:hypothetical protein